MDKQEIYAEISSMMTRMFEVEPEDIKPETNLFTDLDLDSIDAIDMVVQLQKRTGKKFTPEQFRSVKTVQDVVDVVHQLLNADSGNSDSK